MPKYAYINNLRLHETSIDYIKNTLVPRFKFQEYFVYNAETIARKRVYTSEIDGSTLNAYLHLKRSKEINLPKFKLIGSGPSNISGFTYYMKLGLNYCFKTIKHDEDPSNYKYVLNYINLLKERDALLNCGGLWTPKVFQTFYNHNLPIIVVVETIVGWPLSKCINIIHNINYSNALNLARVKKMTMECQLALETGFNEDVESLPATLVPFIKFWMAELLTAVRFIHEKGVLHRNLTPDNIYINDDGHLKLTDFSMCSEVHKITNENGIYLYKPVNTCTELTEAILHPDQFNIRRFTYLNRHQIPYQVFGTGAYSAPELHNCSTVAEYTTKCDYWSVGCVFFYMMFTINPFDVVTCSLNQSKMAMFDKSFLNPLIVEKRCINIPSAIQLLNILCVEPVKRLDDDSELNNKWLPTTLEFFDDIDFDDLLSIQPPLIPNTSNEDELCYPMTTEKDNFIVKVLKESRHNNMRPYLWTYMKHNNKLNQNRLNAGDYDNQPSTSKKFNIYF